MQILIEKCQILTSNDRKNNTIFVLYLSGNANSKTLVVRNLGLVDFNLSFDHHFLCTVRKLSHLVILYLGTLKRVILCFRRNCASAFCPLLDVCCQFCFPFILKSNKLVEGVQKMFMKRLYSSKLSHLSYSDRLC